MRPTQTWSPSRVDAGFLTSTWDSLGYAHHHLGDHQKAANCFQHALRLFRAIGNRYNEADTVNHLGDTHLDAGDHNAARAAWQLSQQIFTELGHADATESKQDS